MKKCPKKKVFLIFSCTAYNIGNDAAVMCVPSKYKGHKASVDLTNPIKYDPIGKKFYICNK